MIEKLKSVLLTGLVVTSLLQSYMLAYSTSNFDEANRTEYVKTELLGTQIEAESLLFPEQIVLHLGEKRHSVLYPENHFFDLVYNDVAEHKFFGLRENDWFAFDWIKEANKNPGIEIRFPVSLPLDVLSRMLRLPETHIPVEPIDRLYITGRQDDRSVRAYFISDSRNAVYEADDVDLTMKDVEKYVGFGERQPKYRMMDTGVYLALEGVIVPRLTVPVTSYTADQLQKSLFADPSITRRIEERDGTHIYTDGKSGLQINADTQWIVYTDPIAPVEARNDVMDNLMTGVQFINKHGGWNGSFGLGYISDSELSDGQELRFYHYAGAHMILPEDRTKFGYIQVQLKKNIVFNYERSILNLDADKRKVTGMKELPYGYELELRFARFPFPTLIESIYPAYRPIKSGEDIVLIPDWAVKLRDGRRHFMY